MRNQKCVYRLKPLFYKILAKGLAALCLLCAHPAQAQMCQTAGNIIKSVSVVESGSSYNALITWDVPDNLPGNAIGYIIYEFIGAPYCWQSKAIINGLTVINHTLTNINPLGNGYTIAVNTTTEPEPHTRRHCQPKILLPVTFDHCTYEAEIRWVPYTGWDEEDTIYYLMADIGNTGTYTPVGEYTSAASYVWSNVPTRETIKIKIQARNKRDNTAVSDSKPETVFFDFPSLPGYIRLPELQDNGGSYTLSFEIDPATDLIAFEVQRALEDGDFSTVHSFSDKTLSNYTDAAGAGLFRYRIAAKNECGNVVCTSNEIVNIQLHIRQDGNNWQLQWKSAQPPFRPLYTLDRQQPNPANLLLDADVTTYTDPIISSSDNSLKFCYTILGRYNSLTSSSGNCAYCKPTITMPDAVDPLSTVVNPQTGRARNQFGPVINAHPQTYSYRLTILNRNAAVVADIVKNPADNPLDKSWNGCLKNGDRGPEEVYTYHLLVEFEGGEQQIMTGTVAVVYSK